MLTLIRKHLARQFLKESDPAGLYSAGEKRVVPAFQAISRAVPAYRAFLKQKGIRPEEIRTLEDFKQKVPVLNKEFFSQFSLQEMCVNGRLDDFSWGMVSSGFSGNFTFGLYSGAESEESSAMTDFLLEETFATDRKKTLLINALAMGVKIHTSLPTVDTSVRPRMVVAIIKKLSAHFDQFIVVGATYFVKNIIEQGIDEGLNWRNVCAHFIIGEDWFPENYRGYLSYLLGHDDRHPEKGMILSSMGVCEIGLSVFQESHTLARIRRLAEEDPSFRQKVFGDLPYVPMLFYYHPNQAYVETVNEELLFTTVDKKRMMPLVRYSSGDKGRIIRNETLAHHLGEVDQARLRPDWRLPVVALDGRLDNVCAVNGKEIRVEEIKTALYSDFDIAATTTGYFHLSADHNHLFLEIQLREGYSPDEDLRKGYIRTILGAVDVDLEMTLYPYGEFPYGRKLNYEYKFQYR